jgi:hypothetical protein
MSVKLSEAPGKTLIINCSNGEFAAHMNILYTKSEVIRNHISGKFKECPVDMTSFPKEIVEKCVLAFYDELQLYIAEMYEVFRFLMVNKKYLNYKSYIGDLSSVDELYEKRLKDDIAALESVRLNLGIDDIGEGTSHDYLFSKLASNERSLLIESRVCTIYTASFHAFDRKSYYNMKILDLMKTLSPFVGNTVTENQYSNYGILSDDLNKLIEGTYYDKIGTFTATSKWDAVRAWTCLVSIPGKQPFHIYSIKLAQQLSQRYDWVIYKEYK